MTGWLPIEHTNVDIVHDSNYFDNSFFRLCSFFTFERKMPTELEEVLSHLSMPF